MLKHIQAYNHIKFIIGQGLIVIITFKWQPVSFKPILGKIKKRSIDIQDTDIITVFGHDHPMCSHSTAKIQTFLSSEIFDPMPAVTHFFPLEGINEAIDIIHSGNAGKIILEIGSK